MPLPTTELYRRAAERFGVNVHQIKDDQWHEPTPCGEWDVRDLVNHVVGENHWAPPLLAGQTIAEVAEDRLDPELVEACATWFANNEDAYRSAGAIGPKVELAPDAGAQTRLLSAFGRTA